MTVKRASRWAVALLLACWTVGSSASAIKKPHRFDYVDPSVRVDCAPDPNVFEDVCWATRMLVGSRTGYVARPGGTASNSDLTKADGSPNNPFGGDTLDLTFSSYSLGDAAMVVIGEESAFVPDLPINTGANIQADDSLIVKTMDNDYGIFSFTVERKSNGRLLWDTRIGGMLFGKQYIQLATLLPTNKIYGFGEHSHPTRPWPMFARDQPPDAANFNTMNLYGVHNFYIALEDDGKAHGVWVMNSNAQEVTTGPGPHLIYRAIGGRFDVFFFPGPRPEDVVCQYQQVIGTPYLPAYWAFGYGLSHYGFKTFDNMKNMIDRVTGAKIPFDTMTVDVDHMDRYKDWTINPTNGWSALPDYVKALNVRGMHFTILVDAAVEVDYPPFERAMDANANFVSWPDARFVPHDVQDKYPLAKNTLFMLGVVWPDNHTAFPDFFDFTGSTQQWWADEIANFHTVLPFDGLWIDMDEPSNFGTNDQHLFQWYIQMVDSTPTTRTTRRCSARRAATMRTTMVDRGEKTLYDTKNLYGLKETIATSKALLQATGQRGQIISRSTFPTSGHFGGTWTGDNSADWPWLQQALIGVQEFNIFGITHVGSDICGFLRNTTEEPAGAFHSFMRNHNDILAVDQDPSQWPAVEAMARVANLWRYRHLPFLYSLHFASSLRGGTVVRPVFFEFPQDFNTYELSYQFMWGQVLMVAPAVVPDVDEIRAYFPDSATWYSLYSDSYGQVMTNGWQVIPVPRNSTAPVFVRDGFVIPRQEPALTAMNSHANDFELLVTLPKEALDGQDVSASGELFYDDGVSPVQPEQKLEDFDHYHFNFTFTLVNNKPQLDIELVRKADKQLFIPPIDDIEILGYPSNVDFSSVQVNGGGAGVSAKDSSYDADRKILRLSRPSGGFVFLNKLLDKYTVTWKNI
ncbi:Maltase-glucoamylase, intestinal [Aphelenchoides fujianensis]|nr:Maltase-glucoamylase, intestinal [Aphelenchoides fujianensis]